MNSTRLFNRDNVDESRVKRVIEIAVTWFWTPPFINY